MDLPEPMLARLERELPVGNGLVYEPKWDGFRCLATPEVMKSRNERPLQRYFPEVVAGLAPLGDVLLDGELVIWTQGRADFPALLARLHPAASRVERLAAETPAVYVVFDVLRVAGEDVSALPFAQRRERLEALVLADPLRLTPQTADPAAARGWLDAAPGSGIDGVMVKPADLRYAPGKRSMVKVKRVRSVDCVVGGIRLLPDGTVSSLLLGVWDGPVLQHVGVVAQLARATRAELRDELAPLTTDLAGHPWEQGFGLEGGALGRLKGTAGRWTPDMVRDWVPLRPERVAEVSYDHLEGLRFRHPARLVRWRPDRDAASCTVEQLR